MNEFKFSWQYKDFEICTATGLTSKTPCLLLVKWMYDECKEKNTVAHLLAIVGTMRVVNYAL